ncbi:MAG: metallophosphoesterase [Aeromicrobium sp.]|uniref:metallophosphoesterase family protein n=1 Tax=Aeromicrobium sp. TaxID=1871063 RepID=UPI003C694788
MVRVLAVADEPAQSVRSRVRDLDVDLLLAAGDLPWDYLESLVSLLDVPAAYVPGNHEPPASLGRGASPRGMVNVDGRSAVVGGLRIAGLGGCVRYNAGDHQYTQKQYVRRARRLVRDAGAVDVLLTHAPPLGLGDEPDPPHVGIAALPDTINALGPTWHLHGHIHPYGMVKADREIGSTTIRNVIPFSLLDIEPRRSA